jgi:tetratricopeptide (TPR) repeat protein
MGRNMEISNRPAPPSAPFESRDFEELEQTIREQGRGAALELMDRRFRQLELYPQLFEVLKMKCRDKLGLSLISESSIERLDESTQRQLEDGLLSACKEVGLSLWRQGDLQTGWFYLQAIGGQPEISEALEHFQVAEDQVETLIEIAISQGAAPVVGYRLLIQQYGTCSAITTYDMQASRFDQAVQCQMASALLNHVYEQLQENILHGLSQATDADQSPVSGSQCQGLSLGQILQAYPQTSARYGHRIDATHLAAVVRIARLVREQPELQMALELTDYGRDLHPDFNYPGVPPFEDTYVDHQFYYRTQLGFDVDAGLCHFRSKCDSISTERYGPIAYETLADLLIRLGRRSEAITLLAEHVWGRLPPTGLIPNVFLIPQTREERSQLQNYFRERQDWLSFGMSSLR